MQGWLLVANDHEITKFDVLLTIGAIIVVLIAVGFLRYFDFFQREKGGKRFFALALPLMLLIFGAGTAFGIYGFDNTAAIQEENERLKEENRVLRLTLDETLKKRGDSD